ncbi:hypothetical protein GCM10027062_12020 [Nocardioides hungaricus]
MKQMRSASRKLIALFAMVMITSSCTVGNNNKSDATGEISVCELAYYTGDFGAVGKSLTADVRFPIEEVINQDPPLGRPWKLYSEDLGTVGEAQAARTCLDRRKADILVSIAHGYRTYRDLMIQRWQEQDSPLAPTVHGGAIPGNLGGKVAEPLFRGQGLDETLGMSGVLYAQQNGAKRIVIVATAVEGFQLAADAAQRTADYLGVEVIQRIDTGAEQPSYIAEAQKIADLKPDAVIVQAGPVDSATLIKQATEAGISLPWIGETGWGLPEFRKTLGTQPLTAQKSIGFAGLSYNADSPAWKFFSNLWNNTPGYADKFGPPNDAYHYSAYDLMVQTALAVEAGGSYKVSDWAPAMNKVGSAPGTVCYTYADCLKLLREGKDINYEGVTGSGEYTDGGVNEIVQAYTPLNADGTTGTPVVLDGKQTLDIVNAILTKAKCTPADPPNTCTW